MKSTANNYAFIDSQNLNLSIRDQGWKLDFARFHSYLQDRFEITKVFLFIGFMPNNQQLYTYLQKLNYILVFKPTLELPNKTVKGNVDADLVLHTMIEYQNYRQAVIVTGDGDFYCLLEYLHTNQKLRRLVVPNKFKYSSLLKAFHEHTTFLNGTREKLGK